MPTDYDQAFDCAGALQTAGRYAEAAGAFLEAMRLSEGDLEPWVRAGLKAAACAFRAGQIPEAQRLWRMIATLDAAPVGARVEAAGNLAVIEQHHGDIDAAREAARNALELAERHGMVGTAARQHGNLGLIALQTGDLAVAHHHLLTAADGFGRVRDTRGQAQAWNALGEVALRQGRPDLASQRFHDAFELLLRMGAMREAAVPAANLAHLLRRLGRSRDALAMYGEVQAVLSREGDEGAGAWRDLAAVSFDLGDHAAAGEHLARAEGTAATESAQAHVRLDRAMWRLAAGDLQGAAQDVEVARLVLERLRDLRGWANAEMLRRRLGWRQGRMPGDWPAPLQGADLPEISTARAWEEAEIAFDRGDLDGARRRAESLMERFQSLGEPQRGASAWGLARMATLVAEAGGRPEVAQDLDRAVQTLTAHGDVRTAVSVGLEAAMYLAILGETGGARLLHHTLGLHRTSEWPLAWARGHDQVAALLRLPEPTPAPPPLGDPLMDIMDRAVHAAGADDGPGWRQALAELFRLQRLTLVAALGGLPARLGRPYLTRPAELEE